MQSKKILFADLAKRIENQSVTGDDTGRQNCTVKSSSAPYRSIATTGIVAIQSRLLRNTILAPRAVLPWYVSVRIVVIAGPGIAKVITAVAGISGFEKGTRRRTKSRMTG